jgi:hypothetical protein
MSHFLDEPDEFMLILHQLRVPQRDVLAEKCNGVVALVKNGAKTRDRCTALDDELSNECQ